MYQGGSDDFLGPLRRPSSPSADWGIDFEAEVAVVTGDVAMGASAEQALEGVRLVMLANDWSLRNLIPAELAKGFGFLQSKPATAFSPVAVTPDELGDAWQRRPRAPAAAMHLERPRGRPLRRRPRDDLPLRPADRAPRARRATCAPAPSSAAARSATRTGRAAGAASPRSARSRRSSTASRRRRFMQFGDVIRIEMKRDDAVGLRRDRAAVVRAHRRQR